MAHQIFISLSIPYAFHTFFYYYYHCAAASLAQPIRVDLTIPFDILRAYTIAQLLLVLRSQEEHFNYSLRSTN